jgi:hypothetical protein
VYITAESFHQGIVLLGPDCLVSELKKPFSESRVERSILEACDFMRSINQIFIGSKRDFLHKP